MFSRITGKLIEHNDLTVLIEVGGLGYEVIVPPCVGGKLRGQEERTVTLEIHPSFALDGNSGRFTFFGFTNAIEREFFEALLSVASIGPKTAARAFSLPMGRIARAIDAGDYATLTSLPGIGKQKARDIVAKLQGKVAKFLLIQDAPHLAPARLPDAASEFTSEALAVLLQLEYKRAEAEAMIERTLAEAPQLADTETLLAEIYRRKHAHG